MCLDTVDPTPVPGSIYVLLTRYCKRLLDLANGVGLASIHVSVPLLIGVSEYVPVGRLHLRPARIVPLSPVSKGQEPALQEVAIGVRLNIDRYILVDAGLTALWLEVVKRSTV